MQAKIKLKSSTQNSKKHSRNRHTTAAARISITHTYEDQSSISLFSIVSLYSQTELQKPAASLVCLPVRLSDACKSSAISFLLFIGLTEKIRAT
jgi:hypothetical protein